MEPTRKAPAHDPVMVRPCALQIVAHAIGLGCLGGFLLLAVAGCGTSECENAPPALRLRISAASNVELKSLTTLEVRLTIAGSTLQRTQTFVAGFPTAGTTMEFHLGSGLAPGYQGDLSLQARDASGVVRASAQARFSGQKEACERLALTLSPPAPCGNGTIDPGEVCDGVLMAGRTCKGEGFTGGVLACAGTCKALDTGGCTWAVSAGGTKEDTGMAAALDAQGNHYIAGTFSDTATFGTKTLTSKGGRDIFVAKLNPKGQFEWVTGLGGTEILEDKGLGIVVDKDGTIYVVGVFAKTAAFGDVNLTSRGSADIFVVRLSSKGTVLKAVQAGGTGNDVPGRGLALNSAGMLVFSGTSTSSPATFGSQSLALTDGPFFVASVNAADLTFKAVQGLGAGTATQFVADGAVALATDSGGNTCVGLVFSGASAVIGGKTLQAAVCDAKGTACSRTHVAARLDKSGTVLWAVAAGGGQCAKDSTTYCSAWTHPAVAMEASGHCLFGGNFSYKALFGKTRLDASGETDALVVRLDKTSGAVLWAARAGGIQCDHVQGLAADSTGQITLTGTFWGSKALFGPTELSGSGNYNSFIARLSASGVFLWAHHPGATHIGGHGSIGDGLAGDAAGNALVTGSFIGSGTFSQTLLTGNGDSETFIWKVGANGP